jgi:cytoskeleton protein RodZ
MRFTFESQEQGMETLGDYLREERQKQGKTLEQIAQKTRINSSTLQAIEDNRDELLPPALHVRGFLKLYARELGLNMDDILSRLPQEPIERSSLSLPPAPDIETKKIPLLKTFIAVAIVCMAGIWAWQMFFGLAPFSQNPSVKIVSPRPVQPGTVEDQLSIGPDAALPQDISEAERVSKQEAPSASESKSKPAVALQTEEVPPVTPERFMVKFIARGIVWMKLNADDDKTVDITLKNGEQYRISAVRTLTARLGNPALVDVEYNNVAVSLPGKPGVPLDVVFPDIVRQPASPME